MAKFRKRPVVINAVQFTAEVASSGSLKIEDDRMFGATTLHTLPTHASNDNSRFLQIQTLEGMHTASIGDWIICGVNGELYPCKPDIFEKTYEAV